MAKKGKGKPNKNTLSTVRVYGDDKLIHGCGLAIKHLHDTEEPSSMAAEMTVKKAKQLAPNKTGALASSIRSNNQGMAFTDSPYANPIHWGWKARGIEPNWFLLDAARQTEYSWLQFFDEFTDRAIDLMT